MGQYNSFWRRTNPAMEQYNSFWRRTNLAMGQYNSFGRQTNQGMGQDNSFGRQTNPAVGNKIYLLCHNLVNFAKINSRTPDYLCKQYKQLCISINALMKVVPGSIYNQVSIDCNASSDKELSVSQINLLKYVGNH